MSRGILCAVVVSFVLSMGIVPGEVSGGDVVSGWSAIVPVEFYSLGPASLPQIGVDGEGNFIAVWLQQDGYRNHVWSSRYVPGRGWGAAGPIETEAYTNSYNPQVAVDRSGNAVAVWEQLDGAYYSIWSNRYVAGSGWGAAGPIESENSGLASNPQVAVDGLGNAVAVWVQSDGALYNIYSNRYVAGSGWGSAGPVESDDSGPAFVPQVAMDDAGNAIAVWEQHGGVRPNICSSWYVVGAGWSTTVLIEHDDTGVATKPQVAVDGSGNAISVWEQYDGTYMRIWSNRFAAGSGWGSAGPIDADGFGDASDAQVAVDPSGNATAVWYQPNGLYRSISSGRYVVGTGWGPASFIGAHTATTSGYPQVASDPAGNAIAVWEERTGDFSNIWSNRFVAGTGWGTPCMITPDGFGHAVNAQVAADSAGDAVAVFRVYDGVYTNLWSSRYAAPDTTPPTLSLDSPADGFVTEASTVTVSGTTEPDSILDINGLLVAVASDGSFSCEVALADGANVITATSSDAWGNSVTVTLTVTYIDPVHALEEQLSDLQDELAGLQDELDSVTGDLQNASDELTDVTQELDAVRDELSSVRDELSSTDDELRDAKSQNLMLMVALIAFVALAVVMSAMLFNLRRKVGGPDGDAAGKLPPPSS